MDKVSYEDDDEQMYGQHAPPSPADFDKFLPWACSHLEVEATVIITRKELVEYVSRNKTTNKSKPKPKKKLQEQSLSYSDSDFFSNARFSLTNIDKANEAVVFLETVYDASQELVQLKFLKNKKIPRMVIKIISLIIPFHQYLTSITINSGLPKEALYEMSNLLPISNVTEVCLDGTFLLEANYHILLNRNQLKHLSIARCKINDDVVKTIVAKLIYPCPASKTLCVLNMSSNRITDIGAKYLADLLRTNRQICYLNIADNMITDRGAINILSSLVTFALTEIEIFDRRSKFMTFIENKNKLIAKTLKELKVGEFERKVAKRKSAKSMGGVSLKRNKPETSSSINSLANMESILEERAKLIAETVIGPHNDPFSPKITETKNNKVYCFGNNHLSYLNIAYNNLTFASIKKVYEVLKEQKLMARKPRGLINIILDGNYLPESCEELQQINNLLESGLVTVRKLSLSMKKKGKNEE